MSDNYANTYADPCTVCHGRGVTFTEESLLRCPMCGVLNRPCPGHATRCGKCQTSLRFSQSEWRQTGQKPCAYCQGHKTSMWAHDRIQSDQAAQEAKNRRKRGWAIAVLVTYLVTLLIPGNLYEMRFWLIIPAIYSIVIIRRYRRMTPRRLARLRFTTPEEVKLVHAASIGLMAGLWLKAGLNRHHRTGKW